MQFKFTLIALAGVLASFTVSGYHSAMYANTYQDLILLGSSLRS
jgi:hypothetical protein